MCYFKLLKRSLYFLLAKIPQEEEDDDDDDDDLQICEL